MIEPGQRFCGMPEHIETLGETCRWRQAPSQPVYYGFQSFISELGAENQRALTRAGFSMHEKACGIRLLETTDLSQANIVIGGGRGRRMNFDGPSGTLAWAELPCGNASAVRLFFDLDETWIGANHIAAGIQYLIVLVHEGGHAVGLPHAPDGSLNVMAPRYNAKQTDFGPWDLAELKRRYGEPKPIEPPPVAPPIPPAGWDFALAVFEYAGQRYRLEKVA